MIRNLYFFVDIKISLTILKTGKEKELKCQRICCKLILNV